MLADSKNYDWLVTEDFIRNIKNVRDAAEAELGKFSKRGGVISGIGWLMDICIYVCTLLGSIKFQIFSPNWLVNLNFYFIFFFQGKLGNGRIKEIEIEFENQIEATIHFIRIH